MKRAADEPFRVVLVGYGLAGSVFHAPLIAATPGLVLDTVVTTDAERRQRALAAYPEVRLASALEEVWARAHALDLLVVASPNRTHVPVATQALAAGLAVVVDKPMAATAAEARRLAALANERGLLLSAFQNRRWDGDLLTVRGLVERGELGRVHRFESRFERWRPQLRGGWRDSSDPADAGGALYDLGSHLVDQALLLFGPVVSMYAELDVRRAGATIEDDAFLALTHASGVRSHLWMSATAPQVGPRFRVLGSSAGYVKYGLDPQEAALAGGQRPGPGWGVEPEDRWGRLDASAAPFPGAGTSVPTLAGNYPAYYAALTAALRDGTRPPVTAEQAAATLDILEAARVSSHKRRTIALA
jgi:predicted dehydrogenase